MSTHAEATRFLRLLWQHFGPPSLRQPAPPLTQPLSPAAGSRLPRSGGVEVLELWVYPIKSCAGQRCRHWPLTPHGLLFDREFALVDPQAPLPPSL